MGAAEAQRKKPISPIRDLLFKQTISTESQDASSPSCVAVSNSWFLCSLSSLLVKMRQVDEFHGVSHAYGCIVMFF